MQFKQIYSLLGKWTKNDHEQKIILTSVSKGKSACRKTALVSSFHGFLNIVKRMKVLISLGIMLCLIMVCYKTH